MMRLTGLLVVAAGLWSGAAAAQEIIDFERFREGRVVDEAFSREGRGAGAHRGLEREVPPGPQRGGDL